MEQLFGDYYDSVLFLGYGVVYSLLWPLAPLVNYANNMVETRADFSKVGLSLIPTLKPNPNPYLIPP